MGVANNHSIAWGIAKQLAENGAELAFTYQGEAFGRRGLVVCGQSLDSSGMLQTLLGPRHGDDAISVWKHPGGEPTLDQLEAPPGKPRPKVVSTT